MLYSDESAHPFHTVEGKEFRIVTRCTGSLPPCFVWGSRLLLAVASQMRVRIAISPFRTRGGSRLARPFFMFFCFQGQFPEFIYIYIYLFWTRSVYPECVHWAGNWLCHVRPQGASERRRASWHITSGFGSADFSREPEAPLSYEKGFWHPFSLFLNGQSPPISVSPAKLLFLPLSFFFFFLHCLLFTLSLSLFSIETVYARTTPNLQSLLSN
eukprot:gene1512-897_t